MTEVIQEATASLLMRASGQVCAIPAILVIETHRPLPIKKMPDVPDWVLGLSILRSLPVPVLDLSLLLCGGQEAATRFVILRLKGGRRVALQVASVVGVRWIKDEELTAMPPLLADARERISKVGAIDRELILLLETSRLVPPEVWAAIGNDPGGRP